MADAEIDDYADGYEADLDNAGVWVGETDEWLRGFNEDTEDRIDIELGSGVALC